MIRRPTRIVHVGSIVADIVVSVPELPDRGTTVVAETSLAEAGGGYGVLLAARGLGLPAALLGRVGTGPVGSMLAGALARDGIELLLPLCEGEQGSTLRLREPDGTTTSITVPGIEATLSAADLAGVSLLPDDAAYLNCLDLLDPERGRAIVEWIGSPQGLGEAILVLDPGPLVVDLGDDLLDTVLARTDVLSLDERELALVSGAQSGRDAALAATLSMLADEALVLLREGRGRFVLAREGHPPVHYPRAGVGDAEELRDVDDLLAELARLREVAPMPAAYPA